MLAGGQTDYATILKAYHRLEDLFTKCCNNVLNMNANLDEETFGKQMREMFDIIINYQLRDELFLEFCAEKKLIGFLVDTSILANRTRKFHVVHKCFEIFQFFLYNLKDNQRGSITSVLANKSMYKIILHRYDLQEGDTLDYWVNNFKCVIGKIKDNEDLLPLFFNDGMDYCWFPLLTRTLAYFNYGSSMIRTTVSLFALDFLSISKRHEKLQRFLSYFPFANYYIYNMMYILDTYQDIKMKVKNDTLKGQNLQSRLQFLGDLLNYASDLIGFEGNEAVRQINLNAFLKLFLCPIMQEFLKYAGREEVEDGIVTGRLFMFVLKMVLNEFKHNEYVVRFICLSLFKSKIHRDLHTEVKMGMKSEVCYMKDRKFGNIFDHERQETIDLIKLLMDGQVNPSLVYPPLPVKLAKISSSNAKEVALESQNPFLDGEPEETAARSTNGSEMAISSEQIGYFQAQEAPEPEETESVRSVSINGQNWQLMAEDVNQGPALSPSQLNLLGAEASQISEWGRWEVPESPPKSLTPKDFGFVIAGTDVSTLPERSWSKSGISSVIVAGEPVNRAAAQSMKPIPRFTAPSKQQVEFFVEPERKVDEQTQTLLDRTRTAFIGSLQSKNPNKNFDIFLQQLQSNSPKLLLNVLHNRYGDFAVEQEDLLGTEETPIFSLNHFFFGMVGIFSSVNEEQRFVNNDMFCAVLKVASECPELKACLLEHKFELASKEKSVLFPNFVEYTLRQTLKGFFALKSAPFNQKFQAYLANEHIMQFKRAAKGRQDMPELIEMLRMYYNKYVGSVRNELAVPNFVNYVVGMLEEERDLEDPNFMGKGLADKIDVMEFINNRRDAEVIKRRKEQHTTGDLDIIKDSMLKLLLLKRFIYKFWPKEGGQNQEFTTNLRLQFDNYKNNFLSNFWEVNQTYETHAIKYRIELGDAKNNKAIYYLIEDDLNFLIAEKHPTLPHSYKIIVKERLYHMQFTMNGKSIICQSRIRNSPIVLKLERQTMAENALMILQSGSERRRSDIGTFLSGCLSNLLVALPAEFDMKGLKKATSTETPKD